VRASRERLPHAVVRASRERLPHAVVRASRERLPHAVVRASRERLPQRSCLPKSRWSSPVPPIVNASPSSSMASAYSPFAGYFS